MKKIIKYIVLFFGLATTFSACNVLDLDPTDRFSESVVWNSEESVDTYVIGFYGFMKEATEINDLLHYNDAFSDIIKSSSWNQYNHFYNVSLLQESTFNDIDAGAFECWKDCYAEIRQDNEFLRDAAKYAEKFGDEFMNARIAEIKVVRAYAYFKLMRVYGCKTIEKGGVVPRLVLEGPEANDKPRTTWAESWQIIIDDLTFAAEHLPVSWGSQRRFTKAAAYAFLTRAGLYAERWDVVIAAAEKCKELGCRLSPDYEKVFTNIDNPENIFAVNYVAGKMTHRADVFFRPIGDSPHHSNAGLYGGFGPTSELVDSYEMADGSEFSWKEHGENPYVGREPRFYATILYNGCRWEGRNLETYVGGADGIRPFTVSGAAGSTTTGYYLKKYITEGDDVWEKNGSYHFFPFIRYAEVLLNYAEALAEQDWSGNSAKALSALNEVRQRVGLPDREASSLKEFREMLRHERMVELAGEGFRYWDLRRWGIAQEVIHGQVAHGCKITKTSAEGVEPATFKYEQISVDADRTRTFYDRFYAFSIPIVERSNNKLLGPNNPGW